MDFILIIGIAIATTVLLLFLLEEENEDADIIHERLYKISQELKEPEKRDKNEQNLMDYIMYTYLEPFIQRKTKGKFDKYKVIRQKLMETGRPYSDDDVIKFKAKQLFFGLAVSSIMFILLIVLLQNFVSALAIGGLLGFIGSLVPKWKLSMEIKKRHEEITYNLPDALDLLVVCVEAGLGLDAALTRVSSEQKRTAPILARELGRVSKDVLSGVPRVDAFRKLAQRNNVADLKSFVALLIQTDKLGTSIAQSLRVYAETVRLKRKQRAEKLAAEASVKMVIPLVLFILPSMFIVLLGPAAIKLIMQFSN